MKYLLKWFTNNGTEVKKTCETWEQLIEKFTNSRNNRGANFRSYSEDNGKTWIRW